MRGTLVAGAHRHPGLGTTVPTAQTTTTATDVRLRHGRHREAGIQPPPWRRRLSWRRCSRASTTIDPTRHLPTPLAVRAATDGLHGPMAVLVLAQERVLVTLMPQLMQATQAALLAATWRAAARTSAQILAANSLL